MYTINIWSIIVSSIVSFCISSIWYSPIMFGKEWMSLVKISNNDVDAMKSSKIFTSYIIHFVATIVSLSILGFAISAIGVQNATDGAFIGFFAWLGFVAPFGVGDHIWRKSLARLVLIDSISVLITLVVGGAIIAMW